jgi:phosphonate transport system permease protein
MTKAPTSVSRYARKRPWGHWVALVVIALLVAASLYAAEWDLTSLTDPDQRARAFGRMKAWAFAFASPDFSADMLKLSWRLTLQTLSAAVIGTALAVVFATILAMGSSRAVIVGEEHGKGWWRRNFPLRSPAAAFCSLCRLIQDVLRAVPDIVWAVMLVSVIGLGPMTGALALALNITGILAKVYSELWDSVPQRDYEQVRSLGAGRVKTFLYGIRPLAARSVQSFTLMRAECAIRNAAVIGVVGGGGLGADIVDRINYGQWDRVSTLILFTLALTLTADLGSNFIRRQLRSDPNHPRAVKARSTVARLSRGYIGAGFALFIVLWSVWFMGWGNNAPPGQEPKNHLAPVARLFQTQSWTHMNMFQRLTRPDFDPAGLGLGDPERVERRRDQDRVVDLFNEYKWHDAWRPAAWVAWELELRKWFVWRVIRSAIVPLAMAIVGTLLGVILAILLTYPHSLAFMLESSHFTGERPAAWVRGLRFVQLVVARGIGLISRGVPEVMWAFLFIAFFGPGLVTGTIALTIHTVGVLVRVFSETVDNIPYRRFEQSFMGSRVACFGYVAGPVSWRDWMTYSFFQFESNVRTAVVLGVVGVGGLGFLFKFNWDWFYYDRAGTYLLMIILLTVVIDRISRALGVSRVAK